MFIYLEIHKFSFPLYPMCRILFELGPVFIVDEPMSLRTICIISSIIHITSGFYINLPPITYHHSKIWIPTVFVRPLAYSLWQCYIQRPYQMATSYVSSNWLTFVWHVFILHDKMCLTILMSRENLEMAYCIVTIGNCFVGNLAGTVQYPQVICS